MSDGKLTLTRETTPPGKKVRKLFPKEGKRQKMRQSVFRFLFLLPAGAVWLVFTGYPFLRGLSMAFQYPVRLSSEAGAIHKFFWGFRGFVGTEGIFRDRQILVHMLRTVYLLLSWFPVTLVLSLFMAVVLSKIRAKKLSPVYRVLITLPWIMYPVSWLLWNQAFDPNFGWVNNFLCDVLKILKNRPPNWYYTGYIYYWGPEGVERIWPGVGFFMLMFLIGFYNIPQERYEAARLDGANVWQEFWHVSLPGIRNIMFLFLLLNAGFLGGGIIQIMNGEGGVSGLNWYAWGSFCPGAVFLLSGLISLFLVGLLYKFYKPEKI